MSTSRAAAARGSSTSWWDEADPGSAAGAEVLLAVDHLRGRDGSTVGQLRQVAAATLGAECYQRIFDGVIAAIRSGEPMANGAGTGLTVMEALAGWEVSCRLRREVTIGEIHSEAA